MQRCPECKSLNVTKFSVEWYKSKNPKCREPQKEGYKEIYIIWMFALLIAFFGIAIDEVVYMIIGILLVIYGGDEKNKKDYKISNYKYLHEQWEEKYLCKVCGNEFYK